MTEMHDVGNKIRCGNVTNAARLGVLSKCMLQMQLFPSDGTSQMLQVGEPSR